MRIVVNGASGFVGTELVEFLAKEGIGGIATSRTGGLVVPDKWEARKRKAILGGEDPSSVAADLLVHLEVKHHVTNPTQDDEQLFRSVNVSGLSEWLAWCDRYSVRKLIYFSSIKAVKPGPSVVDEDARGPGDSAYGRSKWQAEELVRQWANQGEGRKAIIFRPAVIYGPGNRANMYSFVSAIHRNRFFLVGGSRNVKSVVSLQNVVRAVLHLATRMTSGVQVYNLVDRENFSVAALARIISESLGKRGRIYSIPSLLARLLAVLGDTIQTVSGTNMPLTRDRLNALLEHTEFSSRRLQQTGYQHNQSTKDGLRTLVDWYLKDLESGKRE